MAIAMLVLALAARHRLVEAETLAGRCALTGGPLCVVRDWLVQAFLHNRFGLASLLCGMAATLARSTLLAGLGLLAGIAGLVLYNVDFSAPGLLLSLLMLLRAALRSPPTVRAPDA